MKKNKPYLQVKYAFTLAETLLTLAVIGVIAALTIPSLIANSNKQEYVSSLVAFQSIAESSVKNYMIDNGCIGDLSTCALFDNGDVYESADSQAGWDQISKYFSLTKNCGIQTGQGCFALDTEYKWLNGTYRNDIQNERDNDNTQYAPAKGILANGMSIGFTDAPGNCETNRSTSGTVSQLMYLCGGFEVDVNGQKGPNQFGRDLFGFHIAKDGTVVPHGAFDSLNYTTDGEPECDPSASAGTWGQDPGSGKACTVKVLKEKAMNY